MRCVSTSGSIRTAIRRWRWCIGRGRRASLHHRQLSPGLAAARDRLELATRAGARQAASGRGGHWVTLARPRPVRHGQAGDQSHGRPPHVRRCAQTPRGTGGDIRQRGWRSRTHRRTDDERRCCEHHALVRGRSSRARRRVAGERRTQEQRVDRGRRFTVRPVLVLREPGPSVGGPSRTTKRDRPERPLAGTSRGCRVTGYPGGHVEGYPDTFRALFKEVTRTLPRWPVCESDLPNVCRWPRHPAGDRGHRPKLREERWITVQR